jgi:hypothetical protein
MTETCSGRNSVVPMLAGQHAPAHHFRDEIAAYVLDRKKTDRLARKLEAGLVGIEAITPPITKPANTDSPATRSSPTVILIRQVWSPQENKREPCGQVCSAIEVSRLRSDQPISGLRARKRLTSNIGCSKPN